MKIKKILCSLAVLLTLGLTSCNTTNTYYGEYTEQAAGYDYTTKVYVVTKGDVIQKVEILESSNYYTDPSYWQGASVWLEQEEAILASFEGKSVREIRNSTENNVYDTVAGATLTSNRVYKAVQEALKIKVTFF